MYKLKDLANILFSTRNNVVFVTIYDTAKRKDISTGSTIECAIEEYGERFVERILPENNEFIIYLY